MFDVFSLTPLRLGANLTGQFALCFFPKKKKYNKEACCLFTLCFAPVSPSDPAGSPDVCLCSSMLVLSQAAQQGGRLFTNNLK